MNNILSIILPLILSYFTGSFVILSVLLDKKFKDIFHPLYLCLSIGIGLGINSFMFYLFLHFLPLSRLSLYITDISFIIIMLIILFYTAKRKTIVFREYLKFFFKGKKKTNVLLYFYFAAIIVIFTFLIYQLSLYPHGTSDDAYSMWNMKARFLFRGGQNWNYLFVLPSQWMHADYPLLLPSNVSRIWYYINNDITFVPQVVSLLFFILTLFTCQFGLRYSGKNNSNFLAAMCILGSGSFLILISSQIADIPFGFYILSTLIFFKLSKSDIQFRYRYIFLSGLTSGMALWTKNEGVIFIIAFLLSVFLLHWKSPSNEKFKNLFWYLLGILPAVIIFCHMKVIYDPSNDLMSKMSLKLIIGNTADLSRYYTIITYVLKNIIMVNNGMFVIMLLFFLLNRKTFYPSKDNYMALLIIIFMLSAYCFIYLITPLDLEWHMNTSFNRLFNHLWPSFIFIYFSSLKGN